MVLNIGDTVAVVSERGLDNSIEMERFTKGERKANVK